MWLMHHGEGLSDISRGVLAIYRKPPRCYYKLVTNTIRPVNSKYLLYPWYAV